MIEKRRLTDEIDRIVRDRVRSGEIVNVLVDRAEGADGEPVIDVRVIYERARGTLDAEETVGMTTAVRRRLHELDEDAFPYFYYIAKAEAGKLAEAG